MRYETKERRPKKDLKVTVRAQPESPQPIRPRRITLTNDVYSVVWECRDLPRGAELLIAFQEDPRGPFFHMEFTGRRVIGYGNRGPKHTSRHYHYEARIRFNRAVTAREAIEIDGAASPESALLEASPETSYEGDGEVITLGEGNVQNNATEPCDPPPGPPWTTTIQTS